MGGGVSTLQAGWGQALEGRALCPVCKRQRAQFLVWEPRCAGQNRRKAGISVANIMEHANPRGCPTQGS